MATLNHVWKEIAAVYNVNPFNSDDVVDFFTKKVIFLPKKDRDKIMEELNNRDGELPPSSWHERKLKTREQLLQDNFRSYLSYDEIQISGRGLVKSIIVKSEEEWPKVGEIVFIDNKKYKVNNIEYCYSNKQDISVGVKEILS